MIKIFAGKNKKIFEHVIRPDKCSEIPELTTKKRKYVPTPIFPNKEMMEDAIKRI